MISEEKETYWRTIYLPVARHVRRERMILRRRFMLLFVNILLAGVLIAVIGANLDKAGYDRARWRGLWRVMIQDYLVCAVQNIMTLIGSSKKRLEGAAGLPQTIEGVMMAPDVMPGRLFFLDARLPENHTSNVCPMNTTPDYGRA
jgi:hypothetical protein